MILLLLVEGMDNNDNAVGSVLMCIFSYKKSQERIFFNGKWAQRVHDVGACARGEKRIIFLAGTLFKLWFLRVLTLFTPQIYDGWSGVRGTVVPIWVKKVFQNNSL
jgi:hypothetical protein